MTDRAIGIDPPLAPREARLATGAARQALVRGQTQALIQPAAPTQESKETRK